MVVLTCHCGSLVQVPSTIAGRAIRCLSCEAVLKVPSSERAWNRFRLPVINRDMASEGHLRALCVNVAGFNAIASLVQVWLLYRSDNPLIYQGIQLALSLALVITAVGLWEFQDLSRKIMSGLLATHTALIGLATLTGQMSAVVGLGCLGLTGALLWLTASRATRRLCSPGYQLLVSRSPNQQPRWWTCAVFWAPLMAPVGGIAALALARFAL